MSFPGLTAHALSVVNNIPLSAQTIVCLPIPLPNACFLLWATMKEAAINIHVQVSEGTEVFSSSG